MNSDSLGDEDDIRDPDGMEIIDGSSQERAEFVGPITETKNRDRGDRLRSQEEQELILSILDRNDGTAHIRTIAKAMGVKPHELSIPLERLSETDSVTVTGSGIQMIVSLTRDTNKE